MTAVGTPLKPKSLTSTMNPSRLLAFSIVPFLGSAPLFAAPFLWDGGSGANAYITTAANWNPDGVPPSDLINTNLAFDGIARLMTEGRAFYQSIFLAALPRPGNFHP